MENRQKKNANVFRAFCDDKRLAILELLQEDEKCACALIDALEISQSCLSYHMKILCESGVVEARQEGKWTHYKISEQGGNAAIELLKVILCHSQPCRKGSASATKSHRITKDIIEHKTQLY
ncbi:MAG: metalloregulator ArsR/SmtB family transcription factor [Kiritimatiellia bacterium]